MRKINLILFLVYYGLISIIFQSCGPSSEEIVKQKLQDSIHIADSLANIRKQDSIYIERAKQDSINKELAIEKAKQDSIAQIKENEKQVYHYHPKINPINSISENIKVEELTDHDLNIQGLDGMENTIAAITSGLLDNPKVTFFPDALGSKNIHIIVNTDVGYTTFAGLKIYNNVIINIWKNGTVEVNKEGIRTIDDNNKKYISKKLQLKNKKAIVMVNDHGH